jgi:hypothetical protein
MTMSASSRSSRPPPRLERDSRRGRDEHPVRARLEASWPPDATTR